MGQKRERSQATTRRPKGYHREIINEYTIEILGTEKYSLPDLREPEGIDCLKIGPPRTFVIEAVGATFQNSPKYPEAI
jgi:hypothetical protein